MLEWDDLCVFLAIARHGGLTAAARALRVTQPTMGRRLEVLEQRLGVLDPECPESLTQYA